MSNQNVRSIVFGVIFIFTSFFLVSCDTFSKESGTFSVKFSWEKDKAGNDIKPDISSGEFFVTVRIYEWNDSVTFPGDISANGKQLIQSDPAQMKETGTSINFSDLSYGSRRFVVAEIRKGEELTGGVLFSGMSKLFDFKAGKHTEVNVEMSITPTPGVDENGNRIDAELRIVDENGNLKSYTSGTELKVNLRLLDAVSFTKVYIANSEDNLKTENGKVYKISELNQLDGIDNGYEVSEKWDLSFGLTADEIEILPELKIYARLENEYGTGILLMAKIALDSDSPELTLGLNPSYTNGSETITLNVSANELIRYDSLNIQTSDDKLKFDCPEPENNESLSFTCTIETLNETLADGDYEITVIATDQAGNKAEDSIRLTIDREAPELAFTVYKNGNNVSGGIYLKENDELEIDLILSKMPAETPVVRLGGTDILCKSKAELEYSCVAEMAKQTFSEGIFDLTASYHDIAENQFDNVIVSGVKVDYTAPGVSGATTLVVTKPSGCPLSAVTAAKDGSSVSFSFIVSENLSVDPVIKAVKDTDIIPLVIYSQTGFSYTFRAENIDTGSIQDGTYSIEMFLQDEAGNSATVTSQGFTLITARPSAPSVDTENGIVYRRIPWGSKETGLVKYFSLKADGEVVDENAAWIYVYDGPDPDTASEIGKAMVADKTFPELELNRADRTNIYIAVYDNACNRSDVVKVRNVEWTATMGGKVPGSTIENPHTFQTESSFAATLEQDTKSSLEPLAGGMATTERSGKGSWSQWKRNDGKPSSRILHAAAYDSIHGKMVLFGGILYSASIFYDDTWEWDGANWTQMDTVSAPSARYGHAMAYDSSHGKIILFGGYTKSGLSNETWEWNGTNWTLLDPANSPSARYGHAMVYDSSRGKIVLFGGNGHEAGLSNETWEWDGTNWTQMNPINVPAARYSHSMAYDGNRKKTVMFGGNSGGDCFTETWEWDGTDWIKHSPVNSPYAQYSTYGMTYDSVSGKVILSGGSYDHAETWEWDGTNWTKFSPVNSPTILSEHTMIYDSARDRIVLFGGDNGSGSGNEMWEWDRNDWKQLNLSDNPAGRAKHTMVYDSVGKRIMLFDGYTSSSGAVYFDDIWEWDDGIWTQLNSETSPSGRSQYALAYDSTRNKIVLFGGYNESGINGETWEWDGTDWTQMDPANSPLARFYLAMAYDASTEKVVLFGGDENYGSSSETWEWDGTNWTQLNPVDSPSARFGHTMVYDSVREKIVMFGGYDDSGASSETWEWDGTNWTLANPANSPSGRGYLAMAYDNASGKVILFGGLNSSYNNETWEWDGINWVQLDPVISPSARAFHAMSSDAANSRVLLFGGWTDSGVNDETWEWNSGGNDRPAQIINISWKSSGVTDDSTVTYQALSVLFGAGGIGDITGTSTEGADLLAWRCNRWVKVSSNLAGVDSLEPVTWETTDDSEIQMLFNSSLGQLNFAVAPTAPNGMLTDMGKIVTDYAEIVVRYSINE